MLRSRSTRCQTPRSASMNTVSAVLSIFPTSGPSSPSFLLDDGEHMSYSPGDSMQLLMAISVIGVRSELKGSQCARRSGTLAAPVSAQDPSSWSNQSSKSVHDGDFCTSLAVVEVSDEATGSPARKLNANCVRQSVLEICQQEDSLSQ